MENTIEQTGFKAPINLEASPEPSILSQANAVGQGLDVFGRVNPDSFVMPLMDPLKSGMKSFTFLGKEFLIPKYITPIENTKSYFEGETCNTREEFQNSVAFNAGAKVGYGLFSGEMKAAYSREFKSSSEYAYTYHNFYSTMGILELGESEGFLRNSFQGSIDKLPATVSESNLNVFIDFFKDYGIYYTDKVELGGSMEFYVSVKKTSELTDTQISAMMKAQYNGLFVSGSISAEIKGSATWKSYSSASQYRIVVTGGNPALAGALTGIDPMNPSNATVDAYNAWLNSVVTSPAITNMKLKGIWMLCGEKKNVVNEAWSLYSSTIHPKITIETTASNILWPIRQAANTPIITLNGESIKPKTPPSTPCGYQATILSNDGNTPQVLFDKYFCLDAATRSWTNAWPALYQQISDEIMNSEFYKKDNIFLLTSFSMANNIPPDKTGYEFLKLNGGGNRLEFWETHCDRGSQIANDSVWITNVLNYIIAGNLRNGPNVGVELLQYPQEYAKPLNSQMVLYLFKDSFTGKYTISS